MALACTYAMSNNWYVNLKRAGRPSFATVNKPFSLDFTIENSGSEPIKTLDIKYTPNGGSPMTVHHQFDEPLEASESRTFTVDGFVCDITGKEIFGTLTLTGINGEQNTGSDAYVYVVCGNRYIKRNLVVEEATGTDCGWCPEGIVGMEHMRETYTDGSWIGICVYKCPTLNTTSTVYSSWYKRVGSTPKAIANRDFASNYRPSKATLEDLYQRTLNDAAVVGIRANVNADAASKTAKVDVQTYYAFNESNANYKIAYTITEDNVGPYYQYNQYSGSTKYDVDGWENKDPYVLWTFTDVARKGSIYDGIEGSIPTELTSDNTYNYSCDADLSYVDDISSAYITIMVLNADGQIENAVRRKVDGSQNDIQSTTSVIANTPNAVGGASELYDLQGRKVTGTAKPGIYIERQPSGSTRKIAIK